MLHEMAVCVGNEDDEMLRGVLDEFHSIFRRVTGPQLMVSLKDCETAERKLQCGLMFPLHTVCELSANLSEGEIFV